MKSLSTTKPHILIKYCPHGINTDTYQPVEVPEEFRKQILGNKEYDFILLWNNRNIRRKQPADVIYAFKMFCDELGTDAADRCCLVMHTQPIDENGTDLPKVVKAVAPKCHIIFSEAKRDAKELNYLYNMADAAINICNNEGFGLCSAEAVMAGTPIIVNVTGGLQDQCGFKLKDTYLTADDYIKISSLHDWRKWQKKVTWGEWVIPIWPKAHSLAGSIPTPYIFDDRVDLYDVRDAIRQMYELPANERKAMGLAGREAFINEMGLSAENMCTQMIGGIEDTLKNWAPKKRYEIYKVK